MMSDHVLKIPDSIVSLIEEGIWPQTEKELLRQNQEPVIPRHIIQQFAPEENSLYLDRYPFVTFAHEIINNKAFCYEWCAIDQIDPERALILGDFGLGSDTYLILDFRGIQPELMRLKWSEGGNCWVSLDMSPDEFCALIKKNS